MKSRLSPIWRGSVACAVVVTCALLMPALAVAETATGAAVPAEVAPTVVQSPDGLTAETTTTAGDDVTVVPAEAAATVVQSPDVSTAEITAATDDDATTDESQTVLSAVAPSAAVLSAVAPTEPVTTTVQNPDGSTTETTTTTGDDGTITEVAKTITDTDNGDGTITRTTVTTTTVSTPTVTTSTGLSRASNVDDETFTYPTTDSPESAGDFAVIARDYHNDNDMEGTVAAETLHVGNPTIGNASNEDYGSNILYLESIDNISELTSIRAGAILIVGDHINISYDYNNGNGVTLTDTTTGQSVSYNDRSQFKSISNVSDATYQIDFDKLWSDFEAYAAAKSAVPNTEGLTITYTDMDDPNLATVHVHCVEGENVINVAPVPTGKVDVTGPADGNYSLVVNILADDSVPSYTYTQSFTVDGVSGGYSSVAGRVLFNYGTYSGNLILTGESTTGALFAPNATVTIDSASHNGSIVAKTVYNENCEIHQAGFKEFKNVTTVEYEKATSETTTTEVIGSPNAPSTEDEDGGGTSDNGNVSDTSLAVLHSSALPSTGDKLMASSPSDVFGLVGAALVLIGLGVLRRRGANG